MYKFEWPWKFYIKLIIISIIIYIPLTGFSLVRLNLNLEPVCNTVIEWTLVETFPFYNIT